MTDSVSGQIPRPLQHLREASRNHRKTFKEVDRLRANFIGTGHWPEWCFLPYAAAFDVLYPGAALLHPAQQKNTALYTALITWRATQGVYNFDEELLEELWRTPLTGQLPTDILMKMPEWAVYVSTPNAEVFGMQAAGFFAHLVPGEDLEEPQLRFLFDVDDTKEYTELVGERSSLEAPGMRLTPFALGISAGKSLQEAIREVFASNTSEHRSWERQDVYELDEEDVNRSVAYLSGFISALLYLCSVNAEYEDASGQREYPSNPEPQNTRKGPRIFPPDAPTVWLTGSRTGAALRRARSQAAGAGSREDESAGHSSPRPHVRVAHWHAFWRGPRNEPQCRELVVKWLPPILVGSTDPEELAATRRHVE